MRFALYKIASPVFGEIETERITDKIDTERITEKN